jgi:ribosomal protein S18 acetylase RimI-like enzyme
MSMSDSFPSSNDIVIHEVQKNEEIATVARLADRIWREHYTPIIGSDQVNYMLEHFQSSRAITKQIKSGYRYFLLETGNSPAGYFSVKHREESLFLSKIYLVNQLRGKGFGAMMMAQVKKLARESGLQRIELTVNRYNHSAIRFYRAEGFEIIDTLVQDIGNGYVMDDYRMCLQNV